MSRVRVLRLIARMNVGGPALQVANLTRNLDPTVFDQRVLTGFVGPGEGDFVDLRDPDLPIERIAGLGRAPRPHDDLLALRALRREMVRFRPHIVHTHTAKAGVLGRLAARSARVPYTVHTFHGHLLHGYFGPSVTRAVVQVERTLAKRTTTLVAVGSTVRDDLLRAGIGRPEQYQVVAPGIELPPPPDRSDARRTLGLDQDVPVVAFVARLTEVKRPDRAIAVMHRVRAAIPNAVLAVVGEGPLLGRMKEDAAGLGDGVVFLGWRADVETVHAAADVVLLTSDNEGMPISLIEAAMCGRPAVTTSVGSAAEVVLDGRTGLVVPPDADALATALVRLIRDDAARTSMGDEARRSSARFGPERLVRDTEAIYRGLVG